ncbi:LysR family transcriptional regulator, partial [Lactiplantibacillus plantarum]
MANFAYEVFSTVVAQHTFYQAAATLNVTPSAVSHSINQLEKELGFPLFIRNRSGVELTSDGRQVLPYVQEILNTESNLRQVADNIQGLHSGSVRIGGFSSVCINWLPRIIREFNHKYPDIKISVMQGNFNEITNWAKIGTIDIGFTSMPVNENLLVHSLINDPIYCV